MSNKFINIDNLKYYNYKINQIKQDTLISGYNIKTLNGESILGEGDIKLENSILQLILTYNELVLLRDNSQLIPGRQYRIIDYITTTSKQNTQSAGHQFDVIVTADDESTLNEVAKACLHEDDTYFTDSDLNAWKIWYCLDNDRSKFDWADNENGKGIIYRMIDEFNNDCPYDFKNIQFKHPNDTITYPDYYYTFSTVIDGTITDHSLLKGYCYSNTMKEYFINNRQRLNNNIFLNTYKTFRCHSNSFGNNCYLNSFGYECYQNSFGNECYSNSFGNDCYLNSFGYECYQNSFGNVFYENSFGNKCFYNSFGNHCRNNSFGDSCYRNSFGDYCSYNFFINNCNYNSFGKNCTSNSFGNDCYNNSFGNDCGSNSFGNNCFYNSFRISAELSTPLKDYCYYNHFDDGCSYNVIWTSRTTGSSNKLQNININRGVYGTYSNYNCINIEILNQDYEIQVYNDESGNICIDLFPVPLTTNDIDIIWGKYFGGGGYGSSSASAIADEEIINSIGVGDYDETEQ